MIKKFRILIFINVLAISGFTQNVTLDKILNALNQTEVFQNCIAFKKDLNAKIGAMRLKNNLDSDQFNTLRLAYTDLYTKHDAFIKAVKVDLSNIENLKTLVNNPESAAITYSNAYQQVKDSYENTFLPLYNNIYPSETRAIPLVVIIKFGIDAFRVIVNTIKNHRLDSEGLINIVLPKLNEKLFNKLKISSWTELHLSEPSDYKIKEEVVIPKPTINSLHGTISFFHKNSDGRETEVVHFESNEGKKDMKVVSDNNNKKQYATDEYFITHESYPLGSLFRLQVNNSGFTYILVLNTDGIALLYPSKNLVIKQENKDIIVSGDATPVAGRVNIPGNDSNGQPQYFRIEKNADGSESQSEELALILSRSELLLEETIEKLNNVSGNLSERITQVFGEKKIEKSSANVIMNEDILSFNADNSSNDVLPLVFKIMKK